LVANVMVRRINSAQLIARHRVDRKRAAAAALVVSENVRGGEVFLIAAVGPSFRDSIAASQTGGQKTSSPEGRKQVSKSAPIGCLPLAQIRLGLRLQEEVLQLP